MRLREFSEGDWKVKRELEMLLESLDGFESPKLKLEQYVTPPNLAAFIAVTAKLNGDLDVVFDLGCGTGILGIAASLLGSYSVGFDIDADALRIAKRNAARIGAEIDFVCVDVRKIETKIKGTVIMNPPFGIQRKHADRPFLEKALEVSQVVYTIHSAGSERFIEMLASQRGFKVTHIWKFSIPLRRTYSFHEKAFKYVPVEVFRIERYANRNAGR